MLRLTRAAGAPPVTDLASYEAEVALTLERGFRWMYFPKRLEQLFEYESSHERSRHLVGVGILWMAFLALYTIMSQRGLAPPPIDSGINGVTRIALYTPLMLGITFAIWWGVRPVVRD